MGLGVALIYPLHFPSLPGRWINRLLDLVWRMIDHLVFSIHRFSADIQTRFLPDTTGLSPEYNVMAASDSWNRCAESAENLT